MTTTPIPQPDGTPPDPDAAGLIPFAGLELEADPEVTAALAGSALPPSVLQDGPQ